MSKTFQLGYFSIFIIFSLILLSNSQLNNQVIDIWHTNEFVALKNPGDSPFKQCILKKRKIHVVYCNRYYECDARANFDTEELFYDEKYCEEGTNFDENSLKCKPIEKVKCFNRIF